jgi:hypothetical protein
MDDAALVAKLRDNVGGLISEDAAQRLERACWGLESLSRASELTAILAEADPSKAEPA